MFRTRFVIGTAVVALLGLSACGGDSVVDKVQNAASETTVSTGDNASTDTVVPGGIPAGLVPEECRTIYNAFVGAMASAMAPGAKVDLDAVFGEAKGKLPEEIQQDVAMLAKVFGDFAKEMEGKENDPAAAAAAIALFSDPKVQAASDRVNGYFEETCPQG